jgi:hypothetical protein
MTAFIKNIKLPRTLSWKRLITLGITLLVFSYLIFRAYGGVKEIFQSGIKFGFGFLLLSFTCQMIGVSFAGLVWGNIVHSLAVKSSQIFDYEVWCLSAVARKIPGFIWSAVSRMYLYNIRYKVSKTLIMITVLVEIIMMSLGALVALGISIIAGFAQVSWMNTNVLLFTVLPIIVIATALLGPRIIQYAVSRTTKKQSDQEIVELPDIRAWDTLRWILGETIVALFAAGVFYFLMKSIINDAAVPFSTVLGALSIAMALGPIGMWLPGDIGLKDGFLYIALSTIIGGSLAAVVTLSWRIWGTLLELFLGGLSAIALSRDLKQLNPAYNKGKGTVNLDRDSPY